MVKPKYYENWECIPSGNVDPNIKAVPRETKYIKIIARSSGEVMFLSELVVINSLYYFNDHYINTPGNTVGETIPLTEKEFYVELMNVS